MQWYTKKNIYKFAQLGEQKRWPIRAHGARTTTVTKPNNPLLPHRSIFRRFVLWSPRTRTKPVVTWEKVIENIVQDNDDYDGHRTNRKRKKNLLRWIATLRLVIKTTDICVGSGLVRSLFREFILSRMIPVSSCSIVDSLLFIDPTIDVGTGWGRKMFFGQDRLWYWTDWPFFESGGIMMPRSNEYFSLLFIMYLRKKKANRADRLRYHRISTHRRPVAYQRENHNKKLLDCRVVGSHASTPSNKWRSHMVFFLKYHMSK